LGFVQVTYKQLTRQRTSECKDGINFSHKVCRGTTQPHHDHSVSTAYSLCVMVNDLHLIEFPLLI